MNTVAFFPVRAPLTALFQYVNGGSCKSISYSSPLSKSLNLSETLQISHTWKIMNWLSIDMISVTVVPSFMHSHLPKFESFGLRWRSLLITLCVAEWQPHWGVLKGSWLSNQFESTYDLCDGKIYPWESAHSVTNQYKRCSTCICPGVLYSDFILIYIFGNIHICISSLQNIS